MISRTSSANRVEGTDAGHSQAARWHSQRVGLRSGRYAHTAAMIVCLDDWRNTLALVHAALVDLDPGILTAERWS
jgi:hypothetical protein